MPRFGESQDPKRHRTFNSRIISAPPRRKSVVGPTIGLPVHEDENDDRLHRTLYRLPGDARGSVESLEKIYDDNPSDFNDEPKQGPSNEIHQLDPAVLESLHRRRASNIRMQNIIKTKILLPMADVVRHPSLSDSKRASFDSSAKSLATNAKEERLPNGESIALQNFGSTDQKPDEPLSASGRRFANIAKVGYIKFHNYWFKICVFNRVLHCLAEDLQELEIQRQLIRMPKSRMPFLINMV